MHACMHARTHACMGKNACTARSAWRLAIVAADAAMAGHGRAGRCAAKSVAARAGCAPARHRARVEKSAQSRSHPGVAPHGRPAMAQRGRAHCSRHWRTESQLCFAAGHCRAQVAWAHLHTPKGKGPQQPFGCCCGPSGAGAIQRCAINLRRPLRLPAWHGLRAWAGAGCPA